MRDNDDDFDDYDESIDSSNDFLDEKSDPANIFGRGSHNSGGGSNQGSNPNSNPNSNSKPKTYENNIQTLQISPLFFESSSKFKLGLSLQKSVSALKSKSESKSKADKQKWIDKFTGKDLNFKKYLEIKFYINGKEIPKEKTIFELFYKYKPNFSLSQVCITCS